MKNSSVFSVALGSISFEAQTIILNNTLYAELTKVPAPGVDQNPCMVETTALTGMGSPLAQSVSAAMIKTVTDLCLPILTVSDFATHPPFPVVVSTKRIVPSAVSLVLNR